MDGKFSYALSLSPSRWSETNKLLLFSLLLKQKSELIFLNSPEREITFHFSVVLKTGLMNAMMNFLFLFRKMENNYSQVHIR